MFGKQPHLSPLALRKQLLIAESELSRAELSAEWQTMRLGVPGLSHRAEALAAWISSAALVVTGIAALRRSAPAPGGATSSWLQKILSGARLASTIWLSFQARRQGHERR
jgi:hypothetical protein